MKRRPRTVTIEEDTGLEIRYNRHPKKQNNIKIAAMYGAYKDGMSLSAIARIYRITRQAVYSTFHSRGYPLRSKERKGLTRKFGISFTLDGRGVLRGTKDGNRVYLHRLVWERAHGPLPSAHVLTFKDGVKTNVTIENLELVPMSGMAHRFNPEGHNQFTK